MIKSRPRQSVLARKWKNKFFTYPFTCGVLDAKCVISNQPTSLPLFPSIFLLLSYQPTVEKSPNENATTSFPPQTKFSHTLPEKSGGGARPLEYDAKQSAKKSVRCCWSISFTFLIESKTFRASSHTTFI